ncbi:hypothetical protein ACFPVT_02420 [Corynebacterium choanae]|uniref:Uncharacterized protein n=1 Tax=Corynebacterium choanae TaxID=1862358 RepID=A0A3G6J4N9_9CORY|nr:hypothetical protein [Corynebacterium choanae]AZA12909.1 hypothetical protein CCHOA_02460 [Corynebacterium choanae]
MDTPATQPTGIAASMAAALAAGYDPLAVHFYDLAHDGARIRSLAQQVADGEFNSLYNTHPRSVVILTDTLTHRQAAQLAAALREPHPLPIEIVEQLPEYVGPLDIVCLVSNSDTPQLIQAARRAGEVSAQLIIAAAGETMLALEPPRETVSVALPPTSSTVTPVFVAAVVDTVLASIREESALLAARLEDWAQRVDDEITACSPDRDPLVNPACQLYAAIAQRWSLHTATSHCGRSVAQLAATLCTDAGLAASFGDATVIANNIAHLPAPARDIFYDPELDGDDQSHSLPQPIVIAWGDTKPPAAPITVRAETIDDQQLSRLDVACRLLIRLQAALIVGPPKTTR